MSIKVMVFVSRKKRDRALLRMLEKEKIEASFTRWIGPFHTALARHEYDAVLVSRSALLSRFTDPVVHLAAAKSRHTLIVYGVSKDSKKISVKAIRYPGSDYDDGILENSVDARKRKTDTLCALITRFLAEYHGETGYDVREACPPYSNSGESSETNEESPGIRAKLSEMHKKIADLLQKAESRGCANDEIQDYLWQDRARNRKKDVQSYISTLKKKMHILYPHAKSAGIEYRNGRYYLKTTERDEK
ncbi:MAG: hypothetical protein JXP39_06725 [Spirochaetales bacterium]|nr:hypothetical protein [Spirochaetales bacterium]